MSIIVFFSIFSSCLLKNYSDSSKLINISINLQEMDSPTFQFLPSDEGIFDVSSRTGIGIKYNIASISNNNRYNLSFFSSSV